MKNDKLRQYKGFLNTPNLWKTIDLKELKQFILSSECFKIYDFEAFNEARLGKRAEQFFNFQVKNSSKYKILARNLQIRNGKLTIGELDALIQSEVEQIHIEIIYKFYLYDPNIECQNELHKWIGPNRKDTFVYKLNKLKEKQLPLLYSKHTKSALDSLSLKAENLKQQVCYKAQLFMPFHSEGINISPLNNDCIFGFYLGYNQIEILSDNMIFIPKKLDWLTEPHLEVDWLNFEAGKLQINNLIQENRSPMVWLKSRNNKLQKCFITFW